MDLIISPFVERQISEILAPLKKPEKWMAFNLPFFPKPFAIVRMEGQPGTGKTTIARHMANQVSTRSSIINFADVANSHFSETETKITTAFAEATKKKKNTLIFEEADALFWDRSMINEDNILNIGIVNTLLVEIDKWKQRQIPSLLLFTTNHPDLIDKALESRITDVVKLQPPIGELAEQMWISKFPKNLKYDKADISAMATWGCTPRQMEDAVIHACRRALLENRAVRIEDIHQNS
jgi:AAA+ superfamily predicted ATPase